MENKSSRKEFLKKIGLLSAGTVLGGASLLAKKTVTDTSSSENGKKVTLLSSEGKLVEVDENSIKLSEKVLQERGHEGIPGKKWVMVIDLSKCRNARECMKACKGAHNLNPNQHHINVLEMQDSDETPPYYMPKPCQHCDNPPCVAVCPVGATFKRQDGIVLINNERCIGCRFCMAACPYSARSFNWFDPKDEEKYKDVPYNIELNLPQKKGTITKCLFSADCLREGKLPYCVSACPNGVYYFGDSNEDAVTNGTTKETVRLSKLLEDNGGYQLMEELGTKPSVFYLPPKNRMFPFEKKKNTNKENLM